MRPLHGEAARREARDGRESSINIMVDGKGPPSAHMPRTGGGGKGRGLLLEDLRVSPEKEGVLNGIAGLLEHQRPACRPPGEAV